MYREKEKILDTGGGVLNVIKYFSNESFLIVNPDTIWNSHYLQELKLMEQIFFKNQKKCLLLVVNKKKSFDQTLKGDFNLKNNLISRKVKDNLNYVYTGLQIVKPEIFYGLDVKVFSMNKIWDQLIVSNSLYAIESNIDFLHISTLEIYKNLLKRNFKR